MSSLQSAFHVNMTCLVPPGYLSDDSDRKIPVDGALMPRRLGIPHDVAARRLDLDHLGAEVAEDLRRQRPQHDRGQIEDLDSGERPRLGFAHRVT